MADVHLSPTALNRFLACEHRTYLDLLDQRGELHAERRPPKMQLLFERGERFEEAEVQKLRDGGKTVVSCEHGTYEERAQKTLAAMRDGAEVIHQGCFLRGT